MKKIKLPQYEEHRLSNGMIIILMRDSRLPIVNFRLLIKSGITSESSGREGLAGIVMKMLKKGAIKRKEKNLIEEIDSIGGSIETRVSYDFSIITGEFLKKDLKKGFNLFTDIVLNPSFPDKELEKLKEKTIAEILTLRDNLSVLCDRNYRRFLFKNHPYSRSSKGKLEDVKNIMKEDVLNFYSNIFYPDNMILLIGGDFYPNRMLKMVENLFGKLKKKEIRKMQIENPEKVKGKEILIVNKTDLTQTQIRIGNIGMEKKSSDFFAGIVANNILGGSFGSRLMSKIRVEKGLSYGIKSYFNARLCKGDFTVSTFTKNNTVPVAVSYTHLTLPTN